MNATLPSKTEIKRSKRHIILTSHPDSHRNTKIPLMWGAATPEARGPIVTCMADYSVRNAIGAHAGSYALYRALAIAAGQLNPDHRPDLSNTAPARIVGPFPSWTNPEKIVSLDPWGAVTASAFAQYITRGIDIRPTIAITRAHINMPELNCAAAQGRLVADNKLLFSNGDCVVTKAAIEPVWYLPGIAKRFGIDDSTLRRGLFEHTGGMFPELITRHDLDVFLPPIGSITIYIFGEIDAITDPSRELAVRVHDECNGSDVFGSDICTCRPYLVQGIEVCVQTAMNGGAGVIIYNRKEGRGLGEVTKFLVYNARKRQDGGDRAETYFTRTECIAGVHDMRFQELMPDALHWLGITKIDKLVSMSNVKYDAIVRSGISVGEQITIPEDRIPTDAKVEMDAKKAAGYFSQEPKPDSEELAKAKGRNL